MTLLFALFLVAHGLIHLIGFAKAFGFAQLPQLTQPVSQTFGVLWLAATLLFLASAWALFAWPRGWWVIGTCAIIVSMVAIAHSWSDARYGALADAVALIGVVVGFLASGPGSLRAEYEHDVDRALSRATAQQPVTEADLEHLPEPVRRYVRASGAVGYLACTTSVSGCMGGFAGRATHDGFRSGQSNTTSSMSRRGSSS